MLPCVDLFLEAATPDPATVYFVLDQHKLDDTHLLAPDPIPATGGTTKRAFTLDVSHLDSPDDLIEYAGGGGLPSGHVWINLTSSTMNIRIDRGVDTRQGVSVRPVAGTLTATVVDPTWDALHNKMIGLTTLIRVRAGSEPVFVGTITSISTTYNADGVPQIDVEAADGIAALNSVHLPARPAETFGERVNAVGQAADLVVQIPAPGGNQTATDDTRTALETLYLAGDTEAGWTFIDRHNQVHAWQRAAADTLGTPTVLFSDDHTVPGHVCVMAVQTSMDTSEVVNQLQVRNLRYDTTDPDPTRHRYVTDTHDYTSPASERYYGVARTSVTTAMADSDLTAYQSFVFTRYDTPERKIHALEYVTDEFTAPGVPPVALIDVADVVRIQLDPQAVNATPMDRVERVARISHDITPTRWVTQLALT